MPITRYLVIVIITLVIVIAAVSSFLFLKTTSFRSTTSDCIGATAGVPIVSKVQGSSFGQITKYTLPSPNRWPNAPYVDRDGSVWFGEWALPGLAHFFPWNGTLIEYQLPLSGVKTTQTSCGLQTSIWSVLRAGRYVWATLMDYNQIVALDTETAKFTVIKLPEGYESPYTLALSPQGSVWFTMISNKPALGEILKNMTLIIHPVVAGGYYIPSSIVFLNSTLAYYTAFSLSTYTGYLFKFNPSQDHNAIVPEKVGGINLTSPNSISYSNGTIWIAEHGPSDVVSYNLKSHAWSVYPTSLNNLTNTALPYFMVSSGEYAYFNEHYGNKIAVLQQRKLLLTEYSVSNPPAKNIQQIENVLTLALGNGTLWFTSVTSNYVAYLNLEGRPDFALSFDGPMNITIPASSNVTLKFTVTGNWSKPLNISFSDTENFTGATHLISFRPSTAHVPAGGGTFSFDVTIKVSKELKPGIYTAAVTVDDGLIYQSAYVIIKVI